MRREVIPIIVLKVTWNQHYITYNYLRHPRETSHISVVSLPPFNNCIGIGLLPQGVALFRAFPYLHCPAFTGH